MTRAEVKKLEIDKSYVKYGSQKFKVADIKQLPGGVLFVGIYDEPPSSHVDYLNPENIESVNE